MRIRHVVVGAVAGLGLAACGAPATSGVAPVVTSTAATPSVSASVAGGAPQRCTAGELTAALGPAQVDGASGQVQLPLVFTNSSTQPCAMWGVPGVDLTGPDDPNGPTYSLPRPGAAADQPHFTVAPGATATATITYLTDTPGSTGSLGSRGWVPTQVVTTPPGDTHQLTIPWTSKDTVTRQDSATHPGSYVGPITAS